MRFEEIPDTTDAEIPSLLGIRVGDQVTLTSNSKRYYGGPAEVIEINIIRRSAFRLRRIGEITGNCRRLIWATRKEFTAAHDRSQGGEG